MKTAVTSLPLCYRFSFDIDRMQILLIVQNWLQPEIENLFLKQSRQTAQLMKSLGIYGYHNTSKTWFLEYGSCLTLKEKNDQETIYSCTIPNPNHVDSVKIAVSRILDSLDFVAHYPHAQLLKFTCNTPQITKEALNQKQLVAIKWIGNERMIHGWVDDSIFQTLEQLDQEQINRIVLAMKKTRQTLTGSDYKNTYRFDYDNQDYLRIEVEGNCCTLCTRPSGLGILGGVGKTLNRHNVDHNLQILEFIVGLATLNDILLE